jgi:P27 family predicted phage terminase small subunit
MPANRKPTALKKLAGNPGKAPLNENEPKPAITIPECPKHLSRDAKKEWRRITPELERLGLISEVDAAALAAYCQAYGRWVEAEKAIKKHGAIVYSPNGYPQQSPHLAIANKAVEQMRRWLVEFGCTPASRSKVEAKPKEDEADPWALLQSL